VRAPPRGAIETDSEIAAFVVEDELAGSKSPAEAVHQALKRLRGAFALVYLFDGEDNQVHLHGGAGGPFP
jgi:glutamine---fructose-6-phosphate transaminase (isomerizing)